MSDALPIDDHLHVIVDHVRRSRAVVVTAQPGAGKTTRVPPALVEDGPVILLQPRRVAARAIARRIADERGWTIGREIGWQIRFERRFSDQTRLLVATEGILTARLQQDALLSDFRTIVIDEFHERSIHADLALALAKQAWRARPDLRLVIMSATLDAAPVAAFLDGCPIVDVPGRLFPVDIRYDAGATVAAAAMRALDASSGDILCFLPGASEIRRAMADLVPQVDQATVEVVPLHGSLDAADQDVVFRATPRRRIIAATNIAETSLTVPRVTTVVDSGWHKVARYDAARAIDSLELERIPLDAADQRAGRAGRIAPGIVWRLWDPRDRLRPHREPEVHLVDLSATVLDVVAWGGDPRRFEWFEAPSSDSLAAALGLLDRLGATVDGRLTALGEQMRRLPLHPRLARMLIAARGARDVVRACALLGERHFLPPRTAATSSDLLSALDDWDQVPPHVKSVASDIERVWRAVSPEAPPSSNETASRRAVLAGYPDRVAQRREPKSPLVRLASGSGAAIGRESGVQDGEFLVAIDLHASTPPSRPGPPPRVSVRAARGVAVSSAEANVARIRIASRVEREWLQTTGSERVHRFDREAGKVRAFDVDRYDALVLAERPVAPDPDVAARLLADAWLERGPSPEDQRVLRRLRFAGRDVDLRELASAAARGAGSLDGVTLSRALVADAAASLDREAPASIRVPSGRIVALEYEEDGRVTASVKLQELFGLADTPRIGAARVPVVFALLAPNGRPVQLTRDLRSFWEKTYPEVRKELRGRYPKHPWPEDPWSAPPTGRTKRRD